MNELSVFLERFRPAPPEELERCQLQRRVDRKATLSLRELEEWLATFPDRYGVLAANGGALAHYRTRYFDTADLRCFHDHRRGRRPRYKVRIRHYLDRNLSFFEIKQKDHHDVTDKVRRQRQFGDEVLNDEDRALIAEHTNLPPGELRLTCQTAFRRVTLTNVEAPERITIDVGLSLGNGVMLRDIGHTAFVEVKLPPTVQRTPALAALRRMGIRPGAISKYCTAVVLVQPQLPRARFVDTLRRIEELEAWMT